MRLTWPGPVYLWSCKEVDVFYIVEIGIDISSVFVILSYCIRLDFRRKVLLCIHIGVIILYTFRHS